MITLATGAHYSDLPRFPVENTGLAVLPERFQHIPDETGGGERWWWNERPEEIDPFSLFSDKEN
jgi:hypothetical protein